MSRNHETELAAATVWWKANMTASLRSLVIKEDGYVRFEWVDTKDGETGSYHLALSSLTLNAFSIPKPHTPPGSP